MAKKITNQRLYNITLYYLSRYDASRGKVRQMLKRRLLKAKRDNQDIPAEANEWIEHIILRMVELGYLDDKRYGQNQVRLLSSQGKSSRFIAGKLAQDGLDPDMIESLLDETDMNEMDRAKRFVIRKKLGYLRDESIRTDYYKKDLAALGRAGFSYETAVKALNGEEDY